LQGHGAVQGAEGRDARAREAGRRRAVVRRRSVQVRRAALLLVLAIGCREKAAAPAAKPRPAEPFKPLVAEAVDGGGLSEREQIFEVGPFTPGGPAVPDGL